MTPNENENERREDIARIVARCVRIGKSLGRKFSKDDRLSLAMGLFYARDDGFNKGRDDILVGGNLNLKVLLGCDEFSLAHDVFQIVRFINKDSSLPEFGTMACGFVPRCGYEAVGTES